MKHLNILQKVFTDSGTEGKIKFEKVQDNTIEMTSTQVVHTFRDKDSEFFNSNKKTLADNLNLIKEDFYSVHIDGCTDYLILGDKVKLNKKDYFAKKISVRFVDNVLIEEWRRAIGEAVKIQREEEKTCAYMSISLLNTSVAENFPKLQLDFYNAEWVYSESWTRIFYLSTGKIEQNFCAVARD